MTGSNRRIIHGFILGLALISAAAFAATPAKINYQGYIKQNGVPLNGPVNMEFLLFDTGPGVGGAQLCTSGVSSVTVTYGRFNFLIGSVGCNLSAIDWQAQQVWLEIAVAGITLTPREQVVAAGYSLSNDDGTPETSFILDMDNAGAGASSSIRFNRGTSGADAELVWAEAADRFVILKDGANVAALRATGVGNADIFTINIVKAAATSDVYIENALGLGVTVHVEGNVWASGEVAADYFAGNGGGLTNVPPGAHNHDATYINTTGDTMSGALGIVQPVGAATSALYVYHTGDDGRAGYFEATNGSSGFEALKVTSNTLIGAIYGYHTGMDGAAGIFNIDNTFNNEAPLRAETNGGGRLFYLRKSGLTRFYVDNDGTVFASGTAVMTSGYMNFGTATGTTGYGFRDSAGTLQFKNNAGAWTNFGGGGNYVSKTGDSMSGPLLVNFNTATSTLAISNTAGGNAIIATGSVYIATGTLTVGQNNGTSGYDVNFYGTYLAGTGGRMYWDASKDAFRAGRDQAGTNWTDANIGPYSFASGYNTRASNDWATAMGLSTTASGPSATAMGGNTTADGTLSTAMGSYTIASGGYSTAMGSQTTASGEYSTAMGVQTTASGQSSLAAGHYVTAGAAANTIALGLGVNDTNHMVNNTASSLMVGFNSTVPTLFVGPGSGVGTYGKVGIAKSNPSYTLDVNGVVAATGTIVLTSGYMNFGATLGTGGYGFRDLAGVLQYKPDVAGSWTNFGAGGSFVSKTGDTMSGPLTVGIADGTALFASSTGGTTATSVLYIKSDNTNVGSNAIYGYTTGAGNAGNFEIANAANASNAVFGYTTGTGRAGNFQIANAANTQPAVFGSTTGTGNAVYGGTNGAGNAVVGSSSGSGSGVYGFNNGTGYAGNFQIANAANANPAVVGTTNGTGNAGFFNITNAANANPAVYGATTGTGSAVSGYTTGAGRAGNFQIANAANTNPAVAGSTTGTGTAVYGLTTGTGYAGYFEINNAANAWDAVRGYTNGTGYAGNFQIANVANASPAVWGGTNGTGRAGYFQINNAANASDAVFGTTSGTGRAGYFYRNNANASGGVLYVENVATVALGTTYAIGGNNTAGNVAGYLGYDAWIIDYGVYGTAGDASDYGVYGYHSSSGAGVYGSTTAGTGVYGYTGTGTGVWGRSVGDGYGVYGYNTSTGRAGVFRVDNTANATDTVYITTNSTTAGGNGLKVSHTGTGGSAGFFEIANALNGNAVLLGSTTGTGNLLQLQMGAADKFVVDNEGVVITQGCPTATMANVGNYCIDKSQRTATSWFLAVMDCQNDPISGQLCTVGQWYAACKNNSFTTYTDLASVWADGAVGAGTARTIMSDYTALCSDGIIDWGSSATAGPLSYMCCLNK